MVSLSMDAYSSGSGVSSDAWPSSMQPKVHSQAHALLMSIIGQGAFRHENIVFKHLSEADQAEMKELHAEWFPIEYP